MTSYEPTGSCGTCAAATRVTAFGLIVHTGTGHDHAPPANQYVTAADTPAVRAGVLGVLTLLAAGLPPARECCSACGCLCRPLEVCPSCHPETVVPW